MKPRHTPTLAQEMRALAEKKPKFAEELRAKALDFEEAATAFYVADDIALSENMVRTWRAANEVYFRARQRELGIPEWEQVT